MTDTEATPAAAASSEAPRAPIDVEEVIRRLPHRYPFLLVDRVLDFETNKSIRALKNVTINEHFFTGHFPHRPVMPGVLMLEALAQSCGLLAFLTANVYPTEQSQLYFAGIDAVRFRRPVVPGDQLILRADLLRSRSGIWKFSTVAEVDGNEAVSAEIMIAPGDLSLYRPAGSPR
jgi:3-hydroxyacyl-[acyl-carrier-protein] dehydratase